MYPVGWGRVEGKDAFASYFSSPWQVRKFAGRLKEIASLLTGVPVEKWEDQEFKKQIMPLEWQTLVRTPTDENTRYTENTWRWFLQVLGTECMRDGLHSEVWVNALMSEYKPKERHLGLADVSDDYPLWLITDVRFPNEADAVRSRGGLMVRIERHNSDAPISLHPSETSLDNYEFDEVIVNDGTLLDLQSKVEIFINKYNLWQTAK